MLRRATRRWRTRPGGVSRRQILCICSPPSGAGTVSPSWRNKRSDAFGYRVGIVPSLAPSAAGSARGGRHPAIPAGLDQADGERRHRQRHENRGDRRDPERPQHPGRDPGHHRTRQAVESRENAQNGAAAVLRRGTVLGVLSGLDSLAGSVMPWITTGVLGAFGVPPVAAILVALAVTALAVGLVQARRDGRVAAAAGASGG